MDRVTALRWHAQEGERLQEVKDDESVSIRL
jgi:hypothetical protein